MATIKWQRTRKYIEGAVKEFEDKAFMELPDIETRAKALYKEDPKKCQEYLTQITNQYAHAAMSKWWELGNTFWGMFSRGF